MIAILISKDAPPPSISGKVKIYKDLGGIAPQITLMILARIPT